MTEYENIVISKSSMPSLIITTILMIVIPVGFAIYWRTKHKQQTRISYLITGAVGFIVTVRVLELGVHYICLLSDNPVSRFILGNTVAYVFYGIIMAGVFEECGRYIILKYIKKKNHTPENAVLYGIGHGGIEILAVILPAIITNLVIVILFSSGNTENALSALNITEETAAAALPTVLVATSYTYEMMGMSVFERLVAMFVHIGLTVIVYYGVSNGRKSCLPLAILLHMLVDTFAAMYQRGAMSLLLVEVWSAVWMAVIMVIAVKLYRKMKAPPAMESVDEIQSNTLNQ